ncbi:Na/Pi symporter [Dinoroseobacter sp. S375]|uniref:Na/Pi symporter n=1 Tax=Dinoroseobacter sp. S375 TaxID=3415136 RepID=UPI003C7E062D
MSADILGRLGIVFFALHFLSQNLRQLASHQLRQTIARFTDRPHRGMLLGAVMITITQSGSVADFVVVGPLRAGMLGLKQAQPILLGVTVAARLKVLFLTLEIRAATMVLIAVSGAGYAYGDLPVQRIAKA